VFLRKDPTNKLSYVNTALLKLKHSYMFQHSTGVSSGSTDTFRKPSQKKINVQMYQIRQQRIMRYVTAANGRVTYNMLLPRNV